MASNRQRCSGRRECLCDMCLDRKVQLLRQAPPDLQRSILMHLPPDNLNPTPPRNSSPSAAATSSGRGGDGDGDGDGSIPSSGIRQQLHTLSLFKLPLWPTNVDAEFDDVPGPPRNPPSVFSDIVIPPLVRERIPTINDCINYVRANAQITGPRKEAAIVEAIDEILTICERKLREETNH